MFFQDPAQVSYGGRDAGSALLWPFRTGWQKSAAPTPSPPEGNLSLRLDGVCLTPAHNATVF